MVVLPSFVLLPKDGPVRALLLKVLSALKQGSSNSEGGPSDGNIVDLAAGEALASILSGDRVASREYFGRAWTLAERVARFGRKEPLCRWMSLSSWLGMIVDALLQSEILIR
jgi:hypothetical protein